MNDTDKEFKLWNFADGTSEFNIDDGFKPVDVGVKTERSVFIQNIIDYPIDVIIENKEDNLTISPSTIKLNPNEIKELKFQFNIKLKEIKPLYLDLKFRVKFVV